MKETTLIERNIAMDTTPDLTDFFRDPTNRPHAIEPWAEPVGTPPF